MLRGTGYSKERCYYMKKGKSICGQPVEILAPKPGVEP